ncbi:MAG: hypothetical protein DMD91_33120 [Candidatus Rokuibacteriota bacterium]|nr:MAG: hypothetical protein DMD91_33120 [Candidatus Rokubacteria bacterium]
MLARRLPEILPPLTPDEAIEVSTIWSVAGLLNQRGGLVQNRPFRTPHHTMLVPGLIGGGSPLHPGEVTLARSCLFAPHYPRPHSPRITRKGRASFALMCDPAPATIRRQPASWSTARR